MTKLPGAMSEQSEMHQEYRDWSAAFSRLQGQPLDAYQFRYSLLRLVSWPSLTHMPEDLIPSVARICALLARKPTAASLIPLTLDVPEEQVFAMIEILRLNQNVEIVGGVGVASTAGAQTDILPTGMNDKPRDSSFIGKIWQRLGIRS